MFNNRFEKLCFIVEELQLTLHLATHLVDPFVARTLARHLLIRSENFIAHARALRRPLLNNGFNIASYHRTKEIYAASFEEYFKVSRHRLSAHVQDLDFGRRIDLWNDIEVEKSRYLVDGALEIYLSLKHLNIPGYILYSESSVLIGVELIKRLHQYQSNALGDARLELASDSLGLARSNTISGLNTTAIHSRAAQLALIRRWIKIQIELLGQCSSHAGIVRIIKARIITDVVSFCDCLVTRQVGRASQQEMEGLDELIIAVGQSSDAITNFVEVSNFQTLLEDARNVRNVIGAHVEVDDVCTISDLTTLLDDYDLDKTLTFYNLASAAFIKTCRSIIFLSMYAADGQRLSGITSAPSKSVSFLNEQEISALAPALSDSLSDEESYRTNLGYWIEGNEILKEDARQFFWSAFGHSEIVETIEEVEKLGGGQRFLRHEFRRAHKFIEDFIAGGVGDDVFDKVVELILACRSGWPYPLAEILIRISRSATIPRKWLICRALGEIGSYPHLDVQGFLKTCAKSRVWPVRLQAVLALYKSFIKNEGLFRLNHKGQQKLAYVTFVEPLLSPLSKEQRLICLIAFASIFSGPDHHIFYKVFDQSLSSLQEEIKKSCVELLSNEDKQSKNTTLSQLISNFDYVGVCVLVYIDLSAQHKLPRLREQLLENCCNRTVVTASHDCAWRHHAMCFLLRGELSVAHEIIIWLSSKNPESLDLRILAAEIQVDIAGRKELVRKEVETIRCLFKLTPEFSVRLDNVEEKIN